MENFKNSKDSMQINWDIFLEKRMIKNFWHCVAHITDLSKNNSYQVVKFFDKEIVIHNHKGVYWAFENKCPHRGARFFKESEGVSTVNCPYHSWSFTPDKSFIPRIETFNIKDKNELIQPIRWKVENISGFLFIAFEPITDIRSQLGKIVFEKLNKFGAIIFRNFSTQTINFYSNWKIAIENALEPYHVSKIHKNSLATLGIDDGENILFEWASILNHEISSKRVKKSASIFRKFLINKEDIPGYFSLYLFPFSMISSTQGITYSHQLYQPLDEGLTRCTTKLWCLKPKNNIDEKALSNFYESASKLNKIIFEEDADICSYLPVDSWDPYPLKYKSSLEVKIDHFRECIRRYSSTKI